MTMTADLGKIAVSRGETCRAFRNPRLAREDQALVELVGELCDGDDHFATVTPLKT